MADPLGKARRLPPMDRRDVHRLWNDETVLCQAVEGSWLARELIRAKLQQGGGQYAAIPTFIQTGARTRRAPPRAFREPCLVSPMAGVRP